MPEAPERKQIHFNFPSQALGVLSSSESGCHSHCPTSRDPADLISKEILQRNMDETPWRKPGPHDPHPFPRSQRMATATASP